MIIFVIILRNLVTIVPAEWYNQRGVWGSKRYVRLGKNVKTRGTPRVAVLTYLSTGWGRRLIHGVVNYARRHGPWHLWVDARGKNEPARLPPGWSGDGIIARLSTPATAGHVAAAGVPTVNVARMMLGGVNVPRVTDDVDASARLATEHLLNRGFRHFAYCGRLRKTFVTDHCQAFTEALDRLGHACAVYKPARGAGSGADWQTQQEDLIRWLGGLPKPVGLLTWTVPRGQQVIDAARVAGLSVPEQVAVLAGDEDDVLCEVCHPPLSGIAVAAERMGHEAAALLNRLMQGGEPPTEPILVEPTGIVARQSTDTLAIDNAEVVRAIRFIRQHAGDPIRVEDVLGEVPVSRSQLDRHFRSILGRTLAAEIRRVHLERAKQLLRETSMPMPEVAVSSGFGSPEYFAHAFKSQTGLTPLTYRNQGRGG